MSTQTIGAGTAAEPRLDSARADGGKWLWLTVAASMFAAAWGGNEFTPLLVMYRLDHGYSPVMVDFFLFAYVVGIVPALLLGGPLSDRLGRRPIMLPAPIIAIAAMAQPQSEPMPPSTTMARISAPPRRSSTT